MALSARTLVYGTACAIRAQDLGNLIVFEHNPPLPSLELCMGPGHRLSVNMQGKDTRYDTARFIFCRGLTRTH
jgi:hypothetical protein